MNIMYKMYMLQVSPAPSIDRDHSNCKVAVTIRITIWSTWSSTLVVSPSTCNVSFFLLDVVLLMVTL